MGRRYKINREEVAARVPSVIQRLRPPLAHYCCPDGKTIIPRPVKMIFEGRLPYGVFLTPEQFLVDLPLFKLPPPFELLSPHTPEIKSYNKTRYVEFKFRVANVKGGVWNFAVNIDDSSSYRTYMRQQTSVLELRERGGINVTSSSSSDNYNKLLNLFHDANASITKYYHCTTFDEEANTEREEVEDND
jgi:hypothetical protein